jgi:hypothetical protein
MTMTVEELIDRARDYWPADFEWFLKGEETPETARRDALRRQVWRERGKQWLAMVEDLKQDLPGFSIRDVTAPSDYCLRCAAYPPAEQKKPPLVQVVVGCLSMIAPVYTVYALHYEYRPRKRPPMSNHQLFLDELPPELRGPADAIARRMETLGVSRLPPDVAATPVPLCVNVTRPPHATLFDALFSDQPDSVP